VVGDDPIRGVLQADVLVAQLAAVRGRAWDQLLNRVDERRKHVGVVVRLLVLQHRDQPLKTHPCIHVLGRQRSQLSARLAVELRHTKEEHWNAVAMNRGAEK